LEFGEFIRRRTTFFIDLIVCLSTASLLLKFSFQLPAAPFVLLCIFLPSIEQRDARHATGSAEQAERRTIEPAVFSAALERWLGWWRWRRW